MRLSPKVTALREDPPGRAAISAERLHLLDADVMILTHASPDSKRKLEADPLFKRLDAVRSGSYLALELPVAASL